MPGMGLGLGLGLQPRHRRQGGAPAPLSISGTPVLSATENEAYAGFTVSAAGGTGPYVYSLVGDWPAGISVNSSTGAVSGTPSEDGSFAGLSVRVTDATLATDDLDAFTLEVAKTPLEVSYVTSAAFGTSNSTSRTWSGISFGAADADRMVIAAVTYCFSLAGNVAGPIQSMTIGGVAATRASRAATSASDVNVEIWYAAVPTGTTGNVVITFPGGTSQNQHAIAIYRAIGSLAVVDSDGLVEATPGGGDVSTNYVAGGFIVAVSARRNGTEDTTIDGGLTSDAANVQNGSDVFRSSFAALEYASAGSQTIGSVAATRLATASFGPV